MKALRPLPPVRLVAEDTVCALGGGLTHTTLPPSWASPLPRLRNRGQGRRQGGQEHHYFLSHRDPPLLPGCGCVSGPHLLALRTSRPWFRPPSSGKHGGRGGGGWVVTELWDFSLSHSSLKWGSSSISTLLPPPSPTASGAIPHGLCC